MVLIYFHSLLEKLVSLLASKSETRKDYLQELNSFFIHSHDVAQLKTKTWPEINVDLPVFWVFGSQLLRSLFIQSKFNF